MTAPGAYECGCREGDEGDVAHARVYREASDVLAFGVGSFGDFAY